MEVLTETTEGMKAFAGKYNRSLDAPEAQRAVRAGHERLERSRQRAERSSEKRMGGVLGGAPLLLWMRHA